MKALNTRLFILFITLSSMAVAGYLYLSHETYKTLNGEIFSTHYQVTYQANHSLKPNPQDIQSAIEKELNRIDQIASSWKEDSEINRYVVSQDKEHFPISDDLNYLLERSEEIRELTSGAFDIEHQVGKLDLSGIAKGYAVDCIANYLTDELGIESYLIDIGGEMRARGINSKGSTWNVGIFIPHKKNVIEPPKVTLNNTSIATTGEYFKGRHITDPKTDSAVSNSLISVSVIHPSTTTADALATALFVMGSEKGMAWAEENKIHAIFILKDGTILKNNPN